MIVEAGCYYAGFMKLTGLVYVEQFPVIKKLNKECTHFFVSCCSIQKAELLSTSRSVFRSNLETRESSKVDTTKVDCTW